MTLVNCASDVSDDEGQQATEQQQQQQPSGSGSGSSALDNWRHTHVVTKLEAMVQAMQHPHSGVTFRAQKAFLTSVPAAVAGSDLIAWVRQFTGAEEPTEANHIASLLAIYGYVYPLSDDYSLAVRDDPSCLYRFQSPYYWLSISGRPDNLDYAIYLVKRMIRSKQKPGFEDFEKLALSKLQKLLADRWQFIALQAEEELKLLRERKKNDRMVLEMQEQAYWRVHRPPPGYINSVDHPVARHFSITQVQNRLAKQRGRRQHKEPLASSQNAHHKSGETVVACYEISKAFDWFLHTRPAAAAAAAGTTTAQPPVNGSNPTGGSAAGAGPAVDASFSEAEHSCGPSAESAALPGGQSPWLGDDVSAFQNSLGTGESGLSPKQVKMWSAYFDFLLRDAAGREYFKQFLNKEFSSENLRFWLAVQDYKFGPSDQLKSSMTQIYDEFLAPGAPSEINIDSKTMTITQKGMQSPTRFTFEEAQEHIYLLMKKDSYQRFLRSDDYKTLLQSTVERHAMKKRGALFNFGKKAPQPVPSAVAQPAVATQRVKVEAQGSLEASVSSGARMLKTRPVDQAGPSGCDPVVGRSGADEVAPWEIEAAPERKPDTSAVTPWEDG